MTRLIRSSKLCELLGISKPTEWRWRKAGILPNPIRINGQNYYHSTLPEEIAARFQADEKPEAASPN